jgi:hypothetical protein
LVAVLSTLLAALVATLVASLIAAPLLIALAALRLLAGLPTALVLLAAAGSAPLRLLARLALTLLLLFIAIFIAVRHHALLEYCRKMRPVWLAGNPYACLATTQAHRGASQKDEAPFSRCTRRAFIFSSS